MTLCKNGMEDYSTNCMEYRVLEYSCTRHEHINYLDRLFDFVPTEEWIFWLTFFAKVAPLGVNTSHHHRFGVLEHPLSLVDRGMKPWQYFFVVRINGFDPKLWPEDLAQFWKNLIADESDIDVTLRFSKGRPSTHPRPPAHPAPHRRPHSGPPRRHL